MRDCGRRAIRCAKRVTQPSPRATPGAMENSPTDRGSRQATARSAARATASRTSQSCGPARRAGLRDDARSWFRRDALSTDAHRRRRRAGGCRRCPGYRDGKLVSSRPRRHALSSGSSDRSQARRARRRTRPPGARARSPAGRRRTTRARSGGSCRARAAATITASVSTSIRRPKMWSGGADSWRSWPKYSERGSLMSISTWVAYSGVSSTYSSTVYHEVAARKCSSTRSGLNLLGLGEEAGLGAEPHDRVGVALDHRARDLDLELDRARRHPLEQPEVEERHPPVVEQHRVARDGGRPRTGGGGTGSRSRSGTGSRRSGRAPPGGSS